jgi:UDP-N-acetyl-D-galactosamine dehydrogenase
MGITFKEDVVDIRNSKLVDLAHEYGVALIDEPNGLYDVIVLAFGHKEYIQMTPDDFQKLSKDEISCLI